MWNRDLDDSSLSFRYIFTSFSFSFTLPLSLPLCVFFIFLDYFIFMSAENFLLATAENCEWHDSKSNEKPSEYKLNMKLPLVFIYTHVSALRATHLQRVFVLF